MLAATHVDPYRAQWSHPHWSHLRERKQILMQMESHVVVVMMMMVEVEVEQGTLSGDDVEEQDGRKCFSEAWERELCFSKTWRRVVIGWLEER